jgi:C4-dicarboxylate-specific signal transduction histidine kinase
MNAPMSDRRVCPRPRGFAPRIPVLAGVLAASAAALAAAAAAAPPQPWPALVLVALGIAVAAAGLLLVLVIVAQRRALRNALELLQRRDQELAHAARLAAAGELSASIVHEINQPLSAIQSNADAAEMLLALQQVPLGELQQILVDIRADVLRAHEVIRRLRALLERHETERSPIDLHTAMSDALDLVADEARRRRTALVRRPSATQATVLGDRVQLQQVMLNLLLNAMDASMCVPAAQREVVVETSDDGGELVLRVSDRGAGFGPHPAEALFASFFTTKPGGLGLGLSIARSIVEAHQGSIVAEPRPGGGAVFTIRLATLPGTPAPPRARTPAKANPARTAAPA